MATVASLDVRIGATTEALAAGMRRAEGIVSSGLGKIRSIVTSLPVAFAGMAATTGMAAMAGRAVRLAGELEQAKIAFTTMLGSAKKADAFLREMADFAATTPFQFEDVRNAAQRFLAFGFEASRVIPILTAVGNAAAALGGSSELINRIALALGQMRAKGKISGEEMRQLAEAGIPAWEMLAKTIGVTIPEAMKLAERGAIDVGVALDGFINEMNARFPGMMEKQSTTLLGMWSTIKDEVSLTLTVLGEKIIRAFNLKGVLDRMRTWLGEFRATLERQGLEAALAKALGADTAKSLMRLFETLRTKTLPVLAEVGRKLIDIAITAAPFLLEAINKVVEAIPAIGQFLLRLPAYAKVAFTFLVQGFANLAMVANRTIAEIMRGLDQLPFVDMSSSIAKLDGQFGLLARAAREAGGEHQAALRELQALIEAQRASMTKLQEVVPDVAEDTADVAKESIIRITNVLGEEITGTLKGGFGRGGAEGAEQVKQHINSLRDYAAANPIVLRVRYEPEGQPIAGGGLLMPAG